MINDTEMINETEKKKKRIIYSSLPKCKPKNTNAVLKTFTSPNFSGPMRPAAYPSPPPQPSLPVQIHALHCASGRWYPLRFGHISFKSISCHIYVPLSNLRYKPHPIVGPNHLLPNFSNHRYLCSNIWSRKRPFGLRYPPMWSRNVWERGTGGWGDFWKVRNNNVGCRSTGRRGVLRAGV